MNIYTLRLEEPGQGPRQAVTQAENIKQLKYKCSVLLADKTKITILETKRSKVK